MPADGLYEVGAKILLIPPSPGDNELLLFRNGSDNREWLDLRHVASASQAEILNGTAVMQLLAGDKLEVRFYCGPASGSATVFKGTKYNAFWVHRIG